MKNKYILLASFICVSILSCKKVINVSIPDTAQQIVVESYVSNDSTQNCMVKLSRSLSYNQSNVFPPISNAQVSISDNGGTPIVLNELNNTGYYTTSTANLLGQVGHTYTLHIVADGQTITGTSTISNNVLLDSIKAKKENFGFGGNNNTVYSFTAYYNDPLTETNNYRFVLSVNGARSNSIIIEHDKFTNGNKISQQLNISDSIATGDTINVELQNIDEPTFQYFYGLAGGLNGQNSSSTPANPPSNLTGTKLGYFYAYSRSSKNIIAP